MRNKIFFLFFLISCFILISCNTFSQETDFERWKLDFKKQAEAAGVDRHVLDQVLPQMKLLSHVVESDQKQPEFRRTFWDYTDNTLTQKRIETGRKMMKQHAELLKQIEQKYGVPAKYIVAFWGMETIYGGYKGNINTLDALATLAFDTRRRAFFTKELIAYLKIIQQDQLVDVKGSWAGAFGNFQFMPTTYMAYAVDADGDGKRDLINSLPDAMASAANYLSQMGWNQEVKWGREVIITRPLNWQKIHQNKKKTLKQWGQMGVLPIGGQPWPKSAEHIEASLIMPMGINGPIFLTYSNFDIIMRWNRSQLYALSVGLLSDALVMGTVQISAVRKNMPFSYDQAIEIQNLLTQKGYYKGAIDGRLGRQTRAAIRAYQKDYHLPQDGYATKELLNKMKGF